MLFNAETHLADFGIGFRLRRGIYASVRNIKPRNPGLRGVPDREFHLV